MQCFPLKMWSIKHLVNIVAEFWKSFLWASCLLESKIHILILYYWKEYFRDHWNTYFFTSNLCCVYYFEFLMLDTGLDSTVETVHLSMEEVQKAVREILLHSYQNSVTNVVPNIQLNLQNTAVNVVFEEWFCEYTCNVNWEIDFLLRLYENLCCTFPPGFALRHHIMFWAIIFCCEIIYIDI